MPTSDPGFDRLLEFLHESHGFDFTGYKRPTLSRRIAKRLDALGLHTFDEYLDHLQVHPQEYHVLFDTVLINVTGFYRDVPTWDYLRTEIVPAIVARKGDSPIRVWSAGCATGEEAYTLAILFAEALGLDRFRHQVKIYATDVDDAALQVARVGTYSRRDLGDLPEEYRERYFEGEGGRATFRNDLRRCVVFGRHDLTQDAPISRIDLLTCRNTLMYFTAPTQTKILNRLHYALNDDGYLVLGRAEMLLTHASLFLPVELKHRVFSKVSAFGHDERAARIRSAMPKVPESPAHLRTAELMVESLPLPAVFIDGEGFLRIANEGVRERFGLDVRDVGRPFQDIELSYRPVDVRSAIDDASRDRRPVVMRAVERALPDGEKEQLDIIVTPVVADDGSLIGTVVTFADVTEFHRLQNDLSRSSQELETAYEELQSTNEELETTNEELQSTVEELETTNEELQSANEELETMNEELQSTNSELQSIVNELRLRTEDLDRANFFIDSVLMSLRFGVIVLDPDLRVRSWNAASEELWGLRSGEVTGQALAGLDTGLPLPEVTAVVRRCLAGEALVDEEVDAINRRGRRIRCRLVCTPLRMHGDERAGAVLLIEEVTPDGAGTRSKSNSG